MEDRGSTLRPNTKSEPVSQDPLPRLGQSFLIYSVADVRSNPMTFFLAALLVLPALLSL